MKLHAYRQHEPNIHANEDDAKKCSHANAEIELVDLKKVISLFVLKEADHGSDDDSRKNHKRSVTEGRSQEQER